jgi:hypothetical protein
MCPHHSTSTALVVNTHTARVSARDAKEVLTVANNGDRVEVASSKGKSRIGRVISSSGQMLTIRWDSGDETSLIAGPGTLTVLKRARAAAPAGPAKKTPAKKTAAKKAPAKRAPAKKAPAKRAPAKKTAAKKAPAQRGPVRKAPAKKTPARKATARKAPAKKAPARKAPARKAPAKRR